MTMVDEKAQVCSSRPVAQDCYLTRLLAPRIAAGAAPGQFVAVRVSGEFSPFLRLPLSVCGADPAAGTIDLLYEDVGPKTHALSRVRPEGEVACLGPLGRGFSPPALGKGALLVGGGIGLPPLLFMGEALRRGGQGAVTLLAGARRAAEHLPEEMLRAAAPTVRQATDDGSLGRHGLVTELLAEELAADRQRQVYTCGPHPMMKAVARLCRDRQVACQASLEEYMACGFGVCVGCVVEVMPAAGASPYERYRRICLDGPVFDARQVRWEA